MARSKTIWVVRKKQSICIAHGHFEDVPGEILGTFTVKHEMITAVARSNLLMCTFFIQRFSDGTLCDQNLFLHEQVKELIEEERLEWK